MIRVRIGGRMSPEGAERVARIRAEAWRVAAWAFAIYAVAFAVMVLKEVIALFV